MGRETRRIQRFKERRTPGGFTPWPHACARHPNFARLTLAARALLLELLSQYRGTNNGDLGVAWTLLKSRGWNSRTTIEKARLELESRGWIVRTRQGFRNKCNLYALTMFAIDDCGEKISARPTRVPLEFWKEGANPSYEEDRRQRPSPKSFAKSKRWPTLRKTSSTIGQATNEAAPNSPPQAGLDQQLG